MGSGFLNTLKDDLVALRHEFHGIPELGLNLPHTQARILQELEGLPLEISTGKELSSIAAVLRRRGTPLGNVAQCYCAPIWTLCRWWSAPGWNGLARMAICTRVATIAT